MLPKSDEAMTPKNGGIQRLERNGAGEGNRTLVASLEGWSFTTKLHPQQARHIGQRSLRCQFSTD